MTEPDAWLWKCIGCPVCGDEEAEQFYRDRHAEVGGEFYEVLPQCPTEEDIYRQSEVDELRPLFSADSINEVIYELVGDSIFESGLSEEQLETVAQFAAQLREKFRDKAGENEEVCEE